MTGGGKDFKIPSPTYQKLQRLQAPIYAVWTAGRSKIKKSVVKTRFLQGDPADKIVLNVMEFLCFVQKGISSGYRAFVSPEEAMILISKMDSEDGRKEVYRFLNKRIKNKQDWHSPVNGV